MSDGAARVLSTLRRAAGGTCSGQALSAELGVSRAQVWKHVRMLRQRGYRIEGEPGSGYRLLDAPDRLYPEEVAARLETRWLARRLLWFDSVDSTNRVALEQARQGAPAGTTIVAEGQTAGRGRLGRSFFSPPHLNLYTSIVLRPTITLAEAPTLILTSAVAVAETVAQELPEPSAVEIKWPNDVLLDGLKTSGILMELGAEASRVGFVVLGIGVNLNVTRNALPASLRTIATSLASQRGRPVDRVAFTCRLYGTLEAVLERHAEAGFRAIRPRFETFFRMAGRSVRVAEAEGLEMRGTVLGIDRDGALRIRRRDGRTVRVVAGDVSYVRPGGSA